MVRNLFIKPYNKKHIFIKKSSIFSIFIMYNPHLIYNDCHNFYGFLLLLNKNMTIPYTTNIDDNINDYINKRYKLDFIKNVHKIVSIIDGNTYNIYYINCNSKYYNFIFEYKNTELIWKDYYFLNGSTLGNIEYKIKDFTINNYEILNKLKEIIV